MKWPTLTSVCFLFVVPTLALGQTPMIERQVKGKPDTNINAGIFTTIRNDCTSGPLPAVRLLTAPAHGKVTVKQGRLRATNIKQCLGLELPAFVAIYRSAQNFIGQDTFTLEVIGAGANRKFSGSPSPSCSQAPAKEYSLLAAILSVELNATPLCRSRGTPLL